MKLSNVWNSDRKTERDRHRRLSQSKQGLLSQGRQSEIQRRRERIQPVSGTPMHTHTQQTLPYSTPQRPTYAQVLMSTQRTHTTSGYLTQTHTQTYTPARTPSATLLSAQSAHITHTAAMTPSAQSQTASLSLSLTMLHGQQLFARQQALRAAAQAMDGIASPSAATVPLAEPHKHVVSTYLRERFANIAEVEQRKRAEHERAEMQRRIEEEMQREIENRKREALLALLAPRKRELEHDERRRVERALHGPSNDEMLIMKFNIDITRSKLSCLRPGTWLNDEVINFYMAMLLERDARLVAESKALWEANANNGNNNNNNNGNGNNNNNAVVAAPRRPSYFFNSFFVTKLLERGYSYATVKRWTKKFDVFEMEKIFFPVNISNSHWTMAVLYVQKKEIHFYDSMSGSGMTYLKALQRWIVDEAKEKKQMTLDPNEWILKGGASLNTPQQRNGYDCGVFSICCADYLADDLPLHYSQEEMAHNRLRIASAILSGSLSH